MTNTDTDFLNPSGREHARNLFFGLITALLATGTLFWSVQTLMTLTESEIWAGSPMANLDNSKATGASETSRHPDIKPLQPTTLAQPTIEAYPYDDALNPQDIKPLLIPPAYSPDVEVTGGYSVGIGEQPAYPIKKVYSHWKRIRELQRLQQIDGYCTTQNPAPRQHSAEDRNIIKGNCENNLSG